MAGEKETEVVVPDDGTVTLDLSDNPELAEFESKLLPAQELELEVEPAAAKPATAPVPRVKLQEAVQQPAAVDAARALQEAQQRVDAATATANAERARREAAERAAEAARREADDALTTAQQAQLNIIDNGIEAAQRETEALEAQLAASYEAGDFKGAASIQSKLGRATATLDRLEAEKAAYASGAKKAPTTEGRVESAPAMSQFESYVGQFAPDAQAWLRAHPECVPAAVGGSATANAKMMQGHYAALASNIQPNTPEYFRVIEEHTGHRQPVSAAAEVTAAGVEPEAAPAAKPRTAPKVQPSAPPSRQPPAASGMPRAQRTVTLSADQKEMAKISFPNLPPNQAYAQYARNLVELEAEGKMGRTTH